MRPIVHLHSALAAALALAAVLTVAAAKSDPLKLTPGQLAAADPNTLNIGVRSGVDLEVKNSAARAAELADPAHKKPLYAVIWVRQLPTGQPFAKPVDARAIGEHLIRVLDAQGFRRIKPGQKPDIIIGAKYCRAELPNPYSYQIGSADPKRGGHDEQKGPIVDNLSDSGHLVARPAFFEPLTGLEDRAQRGTLEKLIIMVVAWKYPPPADPKTEIKPLWRSTMTVDDPDHRDLNAVAAKMLEAGAPFFDRELTEPEVTVSQPLPEGHVKLGETKVIEDTKSTPK
jgi:hypothetical protein